MFEFVTGNLSFPGKAGKDGQWNTDDHRLALLTAVSGPFPKSLLAKGTKTEQYFDKDGELIILLCVSCFLGHWSSMTFSVDCYWGFQILSRTYVDCSQ